MPQDQLDARRRKARRTALALALAAVAVYALFMLTGTIAQ